MAKKLLLFSMIVIVVAFFTLPQLIFADEGDADEYIGVEDSEVHGGVYTGQYKMGDSEDTITDDSSQENGGAGDGDTDVLCIDGDVTTNKNVDYDGISETKVSDDLADEDMVDSVDGEPLTDEEGAEAVEIIASNETGASPTEDQVAVWEITDDAKPNVYNSLDAEQKENVDKIVEAATDIAKANNDENPDNDVALDEISDIEVVLDDEPLYDETTGNANEHTAEAIMKEPFVPEVTDGESAEGKDPEETIGNTPEEITATGAKTVFWYILEGSYNVSFDPNEVVTETTSGMYDYEDDVTDQDGDGETTDDHFGKAEVNYYFVPWGGDYPENEEMNVKLGAWVDIDEDQKLDVVDETENGDVVDAIQEDMAVVKTTDNGNGGEVTIDNNETPGDYTDDTVETEEIPDEKFDVHTNEGGKVIKSESDVKQGNDGSEGNLKYQRFITDAGDEPVATSEQKYEAWAEIEIQKTDATSGSPLEGSTFQLYRVLTEFDAELIDEVVLEPGSNGNHSWDGLYWGTYFVRETVAPTGYELAPDAYATVGYDFEDEEDYGSLNAYIEEDIADPRIPGSITIYKYGGDTPLGGAVFDVVNGDGTFVATVTTDDSGFATLTGLEWGTYYIKETVAPDGYSVDPNTYTLILGATALSASKDVEDDPIPPPTPPATPPETVEVAGISEIEVLGISDELPFTGLNPIIPITGGCLLFAGLAILLASMINRKKHWKHAMSRINRK